MTMTNLPCRSDCPAGDCAGCGLPPAPRARCVPCACPQADRCERACMHPWDGIPDIDASVALVDGMCPLFVDRKWSADRPDTFTAAQLRAALTYDSSTGVFRWINPRARVIRTGAAFGSDQNAQFRRTWQNCMSRPLFCDPYAHQAGGVRPELVPTVKGNTLHVPKFACARCNRASQQSGSAYIRTCDRRLHICANCKAALQRRAEARANPPEDTC
jgi:hypothetical protein